MASKGITSEWFWNRTLTFSMPRVVVLQIWQLGLINRCLQVAVVGYLWWSIRSENTWAYREVPSSQMNAWIEGASVASSWASTGSSMAATYPYCSNSSYEFTYSAEFPFTNIECEAVNAFEVATKLPGTAAVATVYLDITEEGWACSSGSAASKASSCTAAGGQVSTLFGTQCICTTKKTTYPVGTEDMYVAFDHRFSTSEKMNFLAGSSALATDALTTTTIEYMSGQDIEFAPGASVRFRLNDWLKAGGVSLDDLNVHVAPDSIDGVRQPFYRTTGAVVNVDIEYTNIPKGKSSPSWDRKMVHATVRPRVEADWAGLAVKAPVYEAIPTGPEGAREYKKVLRYSQGVVFKFSGKGFVYRIDWPYLIGVITEAVVLLNVAATITGVIAATFWPSRKMINNKTREHLEIGTRLAEIALKAASYAVNFVSIGGSDGKVHLPDLMRIFKTAGMPLTDGESQTIAKMVIHRTENEDDAAKADEMDFIEYMNGLEAGNMISFDEFKKMVFTKGEDRHVVI